MLRQHTCPRFCIPLSSQAGHSQLRSAAAGDLLIPPTRTVTIGGRVFSVAGPVAWNSLPTDLKDGTLTFPVFKEITENTFICYDMNSCTAPLRRLFERRITSTSFNSIQKKYVGLVNKFQVSRLRLQSVG